MGKNKNWDLIIIGAGPTGMSAAIEASAQGLEVLMLDRQPEPGGQIYRNAGSSAPEKVKALGADYTRGRRLIDEFKKISVNLITEAEVWHLSAGQVCYTSQGRSHCALGKEILVATGGMERPVPVSGWTLPGVMSAGGADILIKSASLAPVGPVIICGNGPLILQTAEHLRHFGVPIKGIVLTSGFSNMFRAAPFMPGLLGRPLYAAHGVNLWMGMLLKSRCYFGSRDISIEKNGGAFSVSFNFFAGKRTLEGATVLLHEGVISESRITRLARLEHVWDAKQRYWHVKTDDWGNTSAAGIRSTGDVAGVQGSEAASARGTLAALDICMKAGRISQEERDARAGKYHFILKRCRAVQSCMDRVFAPNPNMLQPPDDAIVCRCEELTGKTLKDAILQGNYSPNGLKSQARTGMGSCQGRMCGAAVAEMISQAWNIPLDNLEQYVAQPPLVPLSFGELANMEMPPENS